MMHCVTSDGIGLIRRATAHGRLIGLDLASVRGETTNHKPSMVLLGHGKGFAQQLR